MEANFENAIGGHTAAACVFCQSPLLATDHVVACEACDTIYHTECWDANGGCGVYGCPKVPSTEKLEAVEIPMSYWGQERKQCPKCQAEILAAAIRCRECGTVFQSARPEQEEEFKKRLTREESMPSLKRGAIWFFVWSVLPFTAPLAAIFGTAWWRRHRMEIAGLPAIHASLVQMALVVAFGETAVFAGAALFYALLST